MAPLAWGMLLIGVAIGYILSCPMILKMLKEWHDSIEWEQQWLKSYAKITDDQYNSLSDYMNKQLVLIVNHIKNLADIVAKSHSTDAEFTKNVSALFKQETDCRTEWMNKLTELVESDQNTNDERWRLICDYITNQEPEFDKEETNADDIREG